MSYTILWSKDQEHSQTIVENLDDCENTKLVLKGYDIFYSLRKFSENYDGSMCEIIVPADDTEICALLEFCFVLFGEKFTIVLS